MSEVKAVAWLVTWPEAPEVGHLLSDEPPTGDCAHGEPLVPASALAALREEVERLGFELQSLQQQYDERTAYVIVHRSVGLACSAAVRDAYSDEHQRAARLEAENARLREDSERLDFLERCPYFDLGGGELIGADRPSIDAARAALAEREGGK